MLDRVISGGQTGAEQGGLRAARAAGIPTGGWAPRGWLTENGPAPWLADFGLVEWPGLGYSERARRNAAGADVTLWFGSAEGHRGRTTFRACRELGKPCVKAVLSRPSQIVAYLRESPWVKVVNVAGDRESKAPGIGARVERFLVHVFRRLGHTGPKA